MNIKDTEVIGKGMTGITTEFFKVDDKNKSIVINDLNKLYSSSESHNFSPKDIEDLKKALQDTIKSLGGDSDKPEPKFLRLIAREADIYWGAINDFMVNDKVSEKTNRKIAKAFSSVNVIDGQTKNLTNEVEIVDALMNPKINATTISWWYPPMSKLSIYKDCIKKCVNTIHPFQKNTWQEYKKTNGDDFAMMDFQDALENEEQIRSLTKQKDQEDKEITIDIYHHILPSYMQRLIKDQSKKELLISSYYLVFDWEKFLSLNELQKLFNMEDERAPYSKTFKYEPKLHSGSLIFKDDTNE